MLEIGRFFGIVIAMFHRDHNPPHFHAYYGDDMITVNIETGEIRGKFPRRALLLVLEWLNGNKDKLLLNWKLAQQKKPLIEIPPLE